MREKPRRPVFQKVLGTIASLFVLGIFLANFTLRGQEILPILDFVDALWVATSDEIFKVAVADGTILLKITDVKKVRAIAVDEWAYVVWAYGRNTLHAFDFDGEPLFTVPVSRPDGEVEGGNSVEEDEDHDGGHGNDNVALTVNANDGTVWLGIGKIVHHFDDHGEILNTFTLSHKVQALVLDQATSRLWVATDRSVSAHDADMGTGRVGLDRGRKHKVKDIAVDDGSGLVWVALKDTLRRYGAGDTLSFETDIAKLELVASDDQGGVWIATKKRLIRINQLGEAVVDLDSFRGSNKIVALAVDPLGRSVWAAEKKALHQIGAEGQILKSLEFKGRNRLFNLKGEIHDLALYVDIIPPVISFTAPIEGSLININVPNIDVSYSDVGIGVDPSTLLLQAGGGNLSVSCISNSTIATCTPSGGLPQGSITLTATVADHSGNFSALASVDFTVDSLPPETLITGGPDGTVSVTSVVFTVGGSDNLTPPGSLHFAWRIDGEPVSPFSPQTQISLSGLSPGAHTFEVRARDLAGNIDSTPAVAAFTVSLLSVQISEPEDGAAFPAGSFLVRGTVVAGGAEVGVLVNDFPAAVQGNTFAALVPVTPNTTSLTAFATSATGDTASRTITIAVTQEAGVQGSLHASPASGVAPLTVDFSLFGGPVPTQVKLDADGDGLVDFSGAELQDQPFTYDQPGVYVATATVTDSQSGQSTTTAIIQVYDQVALDVILQAKWTGIKDALRQGDIPGTLNHITDRARAKYSEAFRIIGARLPNIDTILTDVTFIKARNGTAIYEATRTDAGITKSFEIRFALDEDGVWRIEAF